jgi:hypothetical protein
VSVIIPSGGSYGLYSNSDLSNPQSFTKLIWAQFAGTPAASTKLLSAENSTAVDMAALGAGYTSGDLQLVTVPSTATWTNFPSQPDWTNWNCYALTGTTAGANSLKGYWQDNAGGGFVSQSMTGLAFTNYVDSIGIGTINESYTAAFYMEWDIPLTAAQLALQFGLSTPVVALANLWRYLPLVTVASAGDDLSENSYDMATSGLSLGASSPTFAGATRQSMMLMGAG